MVSSDRGTGAGGDDWAPGRRGSAGGRVQLWRAAVAAVHRRGPHHRAQALPRVSSNLLRRSCGHSVASCQTSFQPRTRFPPFSSGHPFMWSLPRAHCSTAQRAQYCACTSQICPCCLTYGCGREPAGTKHPSQQFLLHIACSPQTVLSSAHSGGEACPQALCDLIIQCLDRNPDARPTAGALTWET